MAFFGVTLEKIESVQPIPDADRIELARLQGKDFQFVIKKGSFKPGDSCLYFPIDAILPDDIIEKMGLTGKLAGKKKNRIKTVKLRGQISQGIVMRLDLLTPEDDTVMELSPEELTKFFRVEKYEPPEIPCHDGVLKPLPDGQSMYDIEGADRFTDIANLLMDQHVIITEKLEGTNFSVQAKVDGTVFVNQRKNTIIPDEGKELKNTYWKVAHNQKIIAFAKALVEKHKKDAVVFGEMIGPGIQKNIYELKDHQVKLFDIKLGGHWIPPQEMSDEIGEFFGNLNDKVPMIHIGKLKEFLGGRTIKEASNGTSVLNPKRKREGIVIRPTKEDDVVGFGRVILKQRSPEYLGDDDDM